MKVLIADKFPDNHIQTLKDAGLEIINEPKAGENDIPNLVKDADFIVVRSTNVNAAAINAGTNLKIVIRAGSGYNNIDVAAATAKGVSVSNTPGKNSIAVAELAMGLIISLDRKIPDNVKDFKNSVWNKAKYSKAEGLYGKTLGIIGVGNIGKEIAKRAQAFGMKVIGFDVYKSEGIGIEYIDYIEILVSMSDIITLHVPSNPQTKGMFNDKLFGVMKNGAMLINTSRADVIDEDALLRAVKEKGITAGLDVFKGEPEGKDGAVASKLQNVEGIYVTHHIGASTEQAQDAVAEETVKIITEFKKSGKVLNCVNIK
ncbi:MAG: phosphoglycerate dehydrogenase [Ignavibacteriae bacterium HGW-Ignavibacteriae-3]|nr:MAG: phosphoglycerate dehydrogenase [Ignavibacteriae bacterium HGW-Ignavibacteriae-3]